MIRLAILQYWAFCLLGGFFWQLPLRIMGFTHKPALRWDGAKWRITNRLHARVRR